MMTKMINREKGGKMKREGGRMKIEGGRRCRRRRFDGKDGEEEDDGRKVEG